MLPYPVPVDGLELVNSALGEGASDVGLVHPEDIDGGCLRSRERRVGLRRTSYADWDHRREGRQAGEGIHREALGILTDHRCHDGHAGGNSKLIWPRLCIQIWLHPFGVLARV